MEQLSTCLLLLVFERPEQVSLTTVFADFVLFVKYKSRNVFFINNIFFSVVTTDRFKAQT